MGQYYKAVLIDENGVMKTFDPRAYKTKDEPYGMGLKLMEHAWLPNPFVNAVLRDITHTPMRLGWVGDYAKDATSSKEIHALYDEAYSESRKDYSLAGVVPIQLDHKHLDWFFVNKTKGLYLDIRAYFQRSVESDGLYCAHPAPLLTAVGNGMGGGDYHGINTEEVGIWAFDEVFLTKIRPDSSKYIEEMYTFNEEVSMETA